MGWQTGLEIMQPRMVHILVSEHPHPQIQPAMVMQCYSIFYWKNMCFNGPKQFKPILFMGQLYTYIYNFRSLKQTLTILNSLEFIRPDFSGWGRDAVRLYNIETSGNPPFLCLAPWPKLILMVPVAGKSWTDLHSHHSIWFPSSPVLFSAFQNVLTSPVHCSSSPIP